MSNYICLAAMALVVVVMALTPAIRSSAIAIPVWLLVVDVAFRVTFRQPAAAAVPATT